MAFPDDFAWFKPHTVSGSSAGAKTDYVLTPITVHSGSGSDGTTDVYLGGKSENWPYDVRPAATDGTPLAHWREPRHSASECVLWVRVPSIPASPGTVDIRIYYGDSAATDASDGTATFPFFAGPHENVFADDWTVIAGQFGYAKHLDVAKDAVNSPFANANGFMHCVVYDSATELWYAFLRDGLDEISYISSADGKTSWSAPTKVLTKGSGGSSDPAWQSGGVSGYFGPQVWLDSGTWYMVLMGQNGSYWETGYATAPAVNGPWTINSASPIIPATTEHKETAGLIRHSGTWYLYVNDIGTGVNRHVDLWTGPTLDALTLDTANIFTQGRHTAQPYLYDGTFYIIIGHYTVHAGDRSHFEIWRRTGTQSPKLDAANRELVGVLISADGGSDWDGGDIDGPWLPTDTIEKDISNNPVGASTIRLYYGGVEVGETQRTLGFTQDFPLAVLAGTGTANEAKSYVLMTHPASAHTFAKTQANMPADAEISANFRFQDNQNSGREAIALRVRTNTAWYGTVLVNASTDQLELTEYTGSFNTLASTTAPVWNGDETLYPAWLRAHGTSLTAFANDGTDRNLGPQSDATNTGVLPAGIRHWGGGGDVMLYDLRVREYEDPEPTHGAWGSEEANAGPLVAATAASATAAATAGIAQENSMAAGAATAAAAAATAAATQAHTLTAATGPSATSTAAAAATQAHTLAAATASASTGADTGAVEVESTGALAAAAATASAAAAAAAATQTHATTAAAAAASSAAPDVQIGTVVLAAQAATAASASPAAALTHAHLLVAAPAYVEAGVNPATVAQHHATLAALATASSAAPGVAWLEASLGVVVNPRLVSLTPHRYIERL